MDRNKIKIYSNLTQSGVILPDAKFPSKLSTWETLPNTTVELQLSANSTHYGFVQSGDLTVQCSSGEFEIQTGMYYSIPGEACLHVQGSGFCATRLGYSGFFSLGGPIESRGRLKYIDGCSDSLLISPVLLGDPCLNLLFLPPNTEQTAHTHPSVRTGIIVDGRGICRGPTADVFLEPGMIFEIP
ncbi:MAG: cupin domain-containing protein, partial [Planctomycetota bacterium]